MNAKTNISQLLSVYPQLDMWSRNIETSQIVIIWTLSDQHFLKMILDTLIRICLISYIQTTCNMEHMKQSNVILAFKLSALSDIRGKWLHVNVVDWFGSWVAQTGLGTWKVLRTSPFLFNFPDCIVPSNYSTIECKICVRGVYSTLTHGTIHLSEWSQNNNISQISSLLLRR